MILFSFSLKFCRGEGKLFRHHGTERLAAHRNSSCTMPAVSQCLCSFYLAPELGNRVTISSIGSLPIFSVPRSVSANGSVLGARANNRMAESKWAAGWTWECYWIFIGTKYCRDIAGVLPPEFDAESV